MEKLCGNFDERRPVETISTMDIIPVYSGLNGFDICNTFILSSYKAHCTLLRQCLQNCHPAICQVQDGARVIDKCVWTFLTAQGLDNWLVVYSDGRGSLKNF